MYKIPLACLLFLFFSFHLFADRASKVIVIGGGIAGLTTAYRLQEAGIDVELFEARNRVGGRILSGIVDGNIVEFGGQNLSDGKDALNLQALIDTFSLKTTQITISLNYAYFDGKAFLPNPVLSIAQKYDPATLRQELFTMQEKAMTLGQILNSFSTPEDPFYQTIAVRIAAYEGAFPEKLSTYYVDTLSHMLLGGVCSAYPGNDAEENTAELLSIQGGNSLLPEKLADALGSKVHLNQQLLAVSKTVDDLFLLTFHDGHTEVADILVLAIPCSVYADIAFAEEMIPQLETIKKIPYGTNAKILVPFASPPQNRTTLINDHLVAFFNGNCKVLTLYYTGDASFFSSDTIGATTELEYPMLSKRFHKDAFSLQKAEFAKDALFVSYNGPVGYSWPNDPFVKGSYSYIAPGQEELFTQTQLEKEELVKTLFAPLNQKLYFAGEHATILLDIPGTMEAACESGERTARMIKKFLIQ